IKEIRK
ncbi:hypothetical protein CDAR_607311, partial [Caerostris darwini]